MKKIFFATILLISSVNAWAVIKTSTPSIISKIYAYDDFGTVAGSNTADVVVWLQTGLAECPSGVWISASAPGYQTLVSFSLSAYMGEKEVAFQVYSDRVWSGSSNNPLCQVDAVRLL